MNLNFWNILFNFGIGKGGILIEDKISYVDSVNFEILAQLVMVEIKIVTLANRFTEMYLGEIPTNIDFGI